MSNRLPQPSINRIKNDFNEIKDNDNVAAMVLARNLLGEIEKAQNEKATLKDVPQNKTPIVTAEDIRNAENEDNRPLIGDPITKDDDEMVR